MRRVPKRWEKYLPMGCPVPGTRFLPFKVPLKPELCRGRPCEERFTPTVLMETSPMLKAIIDLTDTDRYYNKEEFTSKGVEHRKINVVGGGRIPARKICEQFFDAVDQLCRTLDGDSDALIGVHCTHGLNRTGYLICKYMVLRMKIDPQEAINKFQEARGYEIERKNYVFDIMKVSEPESIKRSHRVDLPVETVNWRSEPRRPPAYPSQIRPQRSESVLELSDYNEDCFKRNRYTRRFRRGGRNYLSNYH